MFEETISRGKLKIDLTRGEVIIKYNDGKVKVFRETPCGTKFLYDVIQAMTNSQNVYLLYDYLLVIVDDYRLAVKYGDEQMKCFVAVPSW